jgi:hypothetical protein
MQDILQKLCPYENTCKEKIKDCVKVKDMSALKAKTIIDNKFWIVEKDGEKFATLRKNDDNKFVMSNSLGVEIFTKDTLTKKFGKDFFIAKIIKEADDSPPNEVHGYPSSSTPHNAMFDIKKKLPLYTKSEDSKSIYCAGYYVIRFDKGWVKSFCPKLITLQRYEFKGPFKTEIEMRLILNNVNK